MNRNSWKIASYLVLFALICGTLFSPSCEIPMNQGNPLLATTNRGLKISGSTPPALYLDINDPVLIEYQLLFNFTSWTPENISVSLNLTNENGSVSFRDSFGDPCYTITNQPNGDQTYDLSIRLTAGDLLDGIFNLTTRIVVDMPLSAIDFELNDNLPYDVIEGDAIEIEIHQVLEISQDASGRSWRLYSSDDLRNLSPTEVVEILVKLFVNYFGWFVIALIFLAVLVRRRRMYSYF